MNKRTLHIALLLLTLVSCQRDQLVDMDVPQKSKLVVSVYVGAGSSSVMAWVNQSQPVIGTPEPETSDPFFVNNASGLLIHMASGQTWPFIFDENAHQYGVTLDTNTIKAGEQYKVTFSSDNETVEGTTVIPQPVATTISVTVDSLMDESFMMMRYRATITCTSQSEGTHHIRLVPVLILNDSFPYTMTDVLSQQKIVSLQKGQSMTQSFSAPYGSEFLIPTSIQVAVLSCDEAYMKYYNSTGFSYSQLGYVSDPNMVYSNMSNKVGVVASYNVSTIHSIPLD